MYIENCEMPSLSSDCSDDSDKIADLENRVSELERIVECFRLVEEMKWRTHPPGPHNRVLTKSDKRVKKYIKTLKNGGENDSASW